MNTSRNSSLLAVVQTNKAQTINIEIDQWENVYI